jgi:hypothetical protein
MHASCIPRVIVAALACAVACVIHAQTTASFTQRAFVGKDFFLGYVLNTPDWVSVEASDDLLTWTPVASVASTNSVTMFLDQGADAHALRFYRLKHPGVAVEDLEPLWQSHSASGYRCEVQHVRTHGPPYLLTATVTVVGGQKTISGAEADGQPLEQPDSLDFPSVEEVFAALKQAQEAGCRRVAMTYDAADGHPVWCVIERLIGVSPGKATDEFRIRNLTYLSNGNGS